ncbi:alpha-2-macroglobulin family protein [Mucilaginibacter flavidus]|uniref:alpha-2-macroglobulin family protein n=1 Tax=Mucilaginibacter flavidus TaxID=2949309 RepID=UPI002092ADE9|nr:alpha-2-macroglobulin family protein [Mucilaginibacter flavidus]MCO5946986.1 carboxypeptidase-like regulatory domain-containing protein [Mucilaginibacter flavidus]
MNYHLRRSKEKNIVQVDYAGVTNIYVTKQRDNYYNNNDDDNKKSWLARIWASVESVFKKPEKEQTYNYSKSYFKAFLILNKPIYKPLDTLKLKAFILKARSNKPMTENRLLVRLKQQYGDEEKTIATVNSYRDGGFEYSFVLADSLKLKLDARYSVMLVSEKVNVKKNDDDNDRSYDAAGHKILVSEMFKYEDYELKSLKFEARIDKKEHRPGESAAIYLKATDENDLPVPDGRVNLILTINAMDKYTGNNVFVPDTLWQHKVTLDPIGETKVDIPDSIFPKANISYRLFAEFLNSTNERHAQYASSTFKYERYHIKTELSNDTLKANYYDNGREIKGLATIVALGGDDEGTISTEKIMLPAKIHVNPYAQSYTIEADSASTEFELKKEKVDMSFSAERTADSLLVKINNPCNLNFWYSVYANNRLIDAGEAKQLFYKKAYSQQKLVTFLVNYIWAGQSKYVQTALAYRTDLLNITVKQPVTIYPGQQVKTDVVVTDALGKPVVNTDITAWSVTKKFKDYYPPYVPYLGREYPYVKPNKIFMKDDDVSTGGEMKLRWERWGKGIGLDSIIYFQFTHAKTVFQREESGIDTVTQIAPFVVSDGDIIPVHILYIDEKPVYFSQADHLQQYSFMVKPGIHSLRFRTSNQLIKLDSICVEASKRLILGVNADYRTSIKMPDTLTTYEAGLINKYMITVIDNFGDKMATIKQDNRIFFLNAEPGRHRSILTGPLSDTFTLFDLKGEDSRSFTAEPGYSYLFEPGLIKQKSIDARYPFNTKLSTSPGIYNLRQYVITQAHADSIWNEFLDTRSNSQELFENPLIYDSSVGKFIINREINKNHPAVFIKNIIIYKYDNPDYMRIYPGNTTNFGNLAAGRYRLFFLLKEGAYDIKENIIIKSYGTNAYKMSVDAIHSRDSVSIKISTIINNRTGKHSYTDYEINNDALKIKEAFNERYLNTKDFGRAMSGEVIAQDDGFPLPGVIIRIKGTNIGTVTNDYGRFAIKVPEHGALTFTFVGFNPVELPIQSGAVIKVKLTANAHELKEVVVTGGYGIKQTSRSNSAQIITSSSLYGKVSALSAATIKGTPGGGVEIRLRGASGTAESGEPLYVVDGVLVKNLNGIELSSISDVSVLKEAAAKALYGVSGANGVVIITTTKQNKQGAAAGQSQSTEQSIRKNFSDYAYWQPKLTTDENGKASFTTVFPDDITNWRTFVIGINGNRQSGFAENQIKSFKPLSASFLAPLFAVEGDELNALGKISNYNSDAAKLTRTFAYNGKQVKQDNLEVSNSKIDTLSLTAANIDSLTFEYSIKRDNGYFDGERRKIPVIKQGVQETVGVFEALNGDTTVNLKFDAAKGPVTFHAEASVLPALMAETEKLRTYKYLCNEQLASKLKGLLMEKRIKKFLGEDFKYEKNINEVIKKLQENRKSQGTWGWWKDSDEELWISLHVIESLVEAQKDGYQTQLDKQKLTDYLVYQMESYKGQDKLVCLELLHKLGAKVDYPKYFGVIEKENARVKEKLGLYTASGYDKLRLLLLKQEAGQAIKLDSLLATQHRTLFGNIYWGEDSYRFFDNSIQLTVLAYKIIKNEGKHNKLLPKIQAYFLEQRKEGEWRNTYESALILETILPDVLTTDKQTKPSALILSGAKTEMVTKFPYTANITGNQFSISKTGTLPVYITGYQQFWNTKPEKVSKDFTVNTWFERKETRLTKLNGGQPVLLKAELTAKGDADFVMIEIPIPAGCSYESKEQSWQNNEVHREYFKEKVSIFCRKLKQGKYEFTVNLIPRYDGKYTLNPAKAEMMYFPVFYGREGMKKVVVGQ